MHSAETQTDTPTAQHMLALVILVTPGSLRECGHRTNSHSCFLDCGGACEPLLSTRILSLGSDRSPSSPPQLLRPDRIPRSAHQLWNQEAGKAELRTQHRHTLSNHRQDTTMGVTSRCPKGPGTDTCQARPL